MTTHKSIRYDVELYEYFKAVSKESKVPLDRLVRFAMINYVKTLKQQYPKVEYDRKRPNGTVQ